MCVRVSFGFNDFMTRRNHSLMAWLLQDGHHQWYGPPEVGVGHALVLYMVAYKCTMAGAPALYYKTLRTTPILLRMDDTSSRPYIRVMTYKTLVFPALKYLSDCHREYTTLLLIK